MYTEMALAARKFALTLAVAGIATLGSVALAPAASAAAPVAQDGPNSVVTSDKGKGPDAWIITERGRTAIFFCDVDKPKKHANKCIPAPSLGGPRGS